jgi:hypothetical protein
MRRAFSVSLCAAVASISLSTGCPGKTGPTTTTTDPTANPAKSGELDKLMRTRMNKSYSQLVFLVFHSEGDPDFGLISEEGGRLSEAISTVLQLPMPPMVQSEQARSVYVDYNETLRRDNEKFTSATARQAIADMRTSLTKIGDTCSACHHFFRVEIKDAK